MARRYTGGLLSSKEQVTDANSASGIFSVQEAGALTAAGAFPTGRWAPSRSLRFRRSASTYLNRTAGTPTLGTKATFSFWIKKADLSLDTNESYRAIYYSGTPNSDGLRIGWARYQGYENHGFVITQDNGSSASHVTLFSNDVFRDPSAWYHFVIRYDSTETNANNRARIFVNSREITSFSARTNPGLNHIPTWQISGYNQKIGRGRDDVNEYYDMYLSEVNFIDGQAHMPSSFGETDPQTGTWIPKRYSGTYGNNGYYLDFRDNTSPTNLALDRSGNGNNWTQNNLSVTAGETNDSMVDVPGIAAVTSQPDIGGVQRGNYPVLSPISVYNFGGTLSNGNLSVSYSDTANNKPTMAVSSGKWYTEVTCTSSGGYSGTGLTIAVTSPSFETAFMNAWYYNNGQTYNYATDSYVSYGASWGTGDVIGVAWDCDNKNVTFYKNGVSQGLLPAGVIYINENGIGTGTSVYPSAYGTGVTSTFTVNYGQRPFAYTPPAGFKSLCSTNLPNPVIKRPSDHFDVKTWVGNGTVLTVGTTAKQSSSYAISNSLRINSSASARLTRTPTSAGNRKTYTISAWVKLGLESDSAIRTIFCAGDSSSSTSSHLYIYAKQIRFYFGGAGGPEWRASQLLRDSTAWYHIVAAVDTNQTSLNNKLKLYVNGVQVNSWVSQNSIGVIDTQINNTIAHAIGSNAATAQYLYDGYMTEFNFIDGQQLAPSNFGDFDANNNWMPKRYTGTYGTNGFYLPFTAGTSTSVGSYNGSTAWFNAANNAAFAFGTGSLTVEAWVYPTQNSYGAIFDTRSSGSGGPGMSIYANSGNGIILVNNTTYNPSTYLSLNQWSHIAAVRNGASAWTVYINGISVLTFTDASNLTDNACFSGKNYAGTFFFGGAISNLRVVKGTAVYTSNFTLPTSPLTNISGTSLLTLQNSTLIDNSTNAFSLTNTGPVTLGTSYPFSAAKIFNDQSPQGNNWTPNNISGVPGSTLDIMLDSPTDTVDSNGNVVGNYCTLDPTFKGSTYIPTISNGSLTAQAEYASQNPAIGTLTVTSGKWYYEVYIDNQAYSPNIGWTEKGNLGTGDNWRSLNNTILMNTFSGTGYVTVTSSNGSSSTQVSQISSASYAWTTGNTVMVALDADAKKVWFGKNGTWLTNSGVGNPGTGEFPTAQYPWNLPMTAAFDGSNISSNKDKLTYNFGQRPFTYTLPTGFKTLNTKNLKDVGSYNLPDSFGNFVNTPDLVWIKRRNSSSQHVLSDTVRGPDRELFSSSTSAQQAGTGQFVQTFNPNGFALGASASGTGDTNISGGTYVGWAWNRGKTPGFDIVNYGGDGVNGRMIPHNLGQAPAFYITKCLTSYNNSQGFLDWSVYHQSCPTYTGNSRMGKQALWLHSTNAAANGVGGFFNTATSTEFSPNQINYDNSSGQSYIAYLWAEVPGFSKFGGYTSNNSTNGPFVYLGFRPRFIMIKIISGGTGNWEIFDTARNTYNQMDLLLLPSDTSADSNAYGSYYIDAVSNGFKVRGNGAGFNGSGETLIYAAFAEAPFKYANAR